MVEACQIFTLKVLSYWYIFFPLFLGAHFVADFVSCFYSTNVIIGKNLQSTWFVLITNQKLLSNFCYLTLTLEHCPRTLRSVTHYCLLDLPLDRCRHTCCRQKHQSTNLRIDTRPGFVFNMCACACKHLCAFVRERFTESCYELRNESSTYPSQVKKHWHAHGTRT